ncbi:ribonuclease III [Thelephora terrestris]|uniref:Ribonuclease III n=1 Tax=Thelephora terrestris TaxID=56493 RepID=A0A9P6HAH8_9AGAM|nr:ribonuclease III [Thelephora terrestris]
MSTILGLHTRLPPKLTLAGALRRIFMDPAPGLSLVISPESIRTPSFVLRAALRPNIADEDLPPLPEIRDKNIRTQVFTHRSYFGRQTRLFEDHPDDPSSDNEMLEHLGDSVLGLVVTELLRDTFPYLRVGPNAKIRALIVGNINLASISLRYSLPDRLRMHPAQVITLKASLNVQADVFESYVGGLHQDQGLDAVRSWLRPLLLPYALESYRRVRKEYGLPPSGGLFPARKTPLSPLSANTPLEASRSMWLSPHPAQYSATVGHLALFNQCLQQESKPVEWVYTGSAGEGSKTTPIWVVQAMVNGDCIGCGRGSTKKAAKNEAAKEGLANLGVHVDA